MITYITEVSISWFLFYTLYHFVLKKLTYFNFNRWYLLGSFVLSLMLPLIPPLWGISEPEPGISDKLYFELLLASLAQFDESTTNISEPIKKINWLIVVYWVGVGLMSLRFLYGLGRIAIYYLWGERIHQGYYRLILTKKIHLPFSFFRWIFWGKSMDLQDPEAERILKHEATHIQQGHTLDVLLVELISLIAWCSPLVYLYRKAFRINHEYLADAAVIKEYRLKEYGHLLIKQSLSGPQIALVNHLIHSQLKNRILMMTKKRSSRLSQLRYFLALPLIALLLTAFSYDADYSLEEIQFFPENDRSAESIIDDKEIEEEIFSPVLNNEIDKIENITLPKKNKFERLPFLNRKLQDDLLDMTTPSLEMDTLKPQPLMVLNGKIMKKQELSSLPADMIESINVLKGKGALDKYGEKGKNGVVEVNCPKCEENTFEYEEKSLESEFDDKLILINEVPADKSIYLKISPDKIATIDISSSEIDVKKYGEKAKNGVVRISCPSCDIGDTPNGKITLKSDSDKDPLFVINGQVLPGKGMASKIKPEQISTINVLKGNSAIEKYGEKGKNGVIEITCPTCKDLDLEIDLNLNTDIKLKPLYLLNDIKITEFQMKKIDPALIETINVIKDPAKLKEFGEEAKSGIVDIKCSKCDVDKIKENSFQFEFDNDFKLEIKPNINIKTGDWVYDEREDASQEVEPIKKEKDLGDSKLNNFTNRELELNNFNVTPNPTKGRLHLRFEAQPKNTQIKVLDSSGREIYTEQLTNFNGLYDKHLDLSKASKGIVLINISQGDQIFNSKVIVQ